MRKLLADSKPGEGRVAGDSDGGRHGPAPDTDALARAAWSLDALLPAGIARRAEEVGVTKAATRLDRLVVLGVLAGAFISLGAVFSTVATAGSGMAPGLTRLVAGLTFSLGLVLVVVAGAELFTGNMLIVIATASRRVRIRALLRNWLIVYLANFAGALLTTLLVFWSGMYESAAAAPGVRALGIAATKTALGFREAVFLGVLANALVCLAVWLSLSARSLADKVLAVVFPVAAFVAAGFEHSIANMYFIPAGLLIKAWAPSSFWATAGAKTADYPTLTWQDFLVGNLLPVTIGNTIGGALLVGLVYWFVYLHGPETDES